MRFLRVGLFVLATTQAALSAPVFRRGASNGTLEVVYLHPIEQNLKVFTRGCGASDLCGGSHWRRSQGSGLPSGTQHPPAQEPHPAPGEQGHVPLPPMPHGPPPPVAHLPPMPQGPPPPVAHLPPMPQGPPPPVPHLPPMPQGPPPPVPGAHLHGGPHHGAAGPHLHGGPHHGEAGPHAHEAQQLRTPPPTPVNQLPVNQHRLPLTPPHTPAKTTFETAHENPEGDT